MHFQRRSKPPKYFYGMPRLLPAALMLAATGCSSLTPTLDEQPFAGADEPAYVMTVTPKPGDTREILEGRYNGTLITWEPGVYAVVGLDNEGLAPQTLAGSYDPVEPNEKAFLVGGKPGAAIRLSGRSRVWAGGKSRVWAGGADSELWAEGKSRIWAGGEFSWMPENTAKWQQIGLEGAHTLATNLGYGVKVAVIDTGVDTEHPALSGALAPASQWYDFVGNDASPMEEGSFEQDGFGHGTNVAGIIRQLAPRATILPIRALDANGEGTVANITAAIQWAVDQGADVINLSLGSTKTIEAIDVAIDNATRRGVFVVASAGNTGDQRVTFPASRADQDKWQVSVTSVDAYDRKSYFANYRTALESAAPGEDVLAPAPGLMMAAWSGTSQAAPMASGALALALGQPLKVKQMFLTSRLLDTGNDLYSDGLNSQYVGKLGQSRLNVELFLQNVIGTSRK